jgi:hypothetical protein
VHRDEQPSPLAQVAVVAGLADDAVDHAVAAGLVRQTVSSAAIAADLVAVVAHLGSTGGVVADDAVAAALRDAAAVMAQAISNLGVGAGVAIAGAIAVAGDAQVPQALHAGRARAAGAAHRMIREHRSEAATQDTQDQTTCNTTLHSGTR